MSEPRIVSRFVAPGLAFEICVTDDLNVLVRITDLSGMRLLTREQVAQALANVITREFSRDLDAWFGPGHCTVTREEDGG